MLNSTEIAATPRTSKKQSQLTVVLRRLSKNPSAMIGLVVVVVLVLMAIFAPLIAPFPYDKQNLLSTRKAPSSEHIMGTDELGRDIFSRIVYGSRYSLSIGFLAVLFSNFIGMTLGAGR